jgi:hypothetical protein
MPRCTGPACWSGGYPADWTVQKNFTFTEYSYKGATGDLFAPGAFVLFWVVFILFIGGMHWLSRWARRRW